jgi:hypothetical protein
MPLIEDAVNKEATEARVPVGKIEVITSKMLRLPPSRAPEVPADPAQLVAPVELI